MRKDKQFQMAWRYESPTVAFITTAVERGFAISFDDDDLFFGDPGAAGDLFDDVIIEF